MGYIQVLSCPKCGAMFPDEINVYVYEKEIRFLKKKLLAYDRWFRFWEAGCSVEGSVPHSALEDIYKQVNKIGKRKCEEDK